jgi:hypothetical protein
MKIQDVYTGMLVKANSEFKGTGTRYVRPNDHGTVVRFEDGQVDVEWNNPIVAIRSTSQWWIDVDNIEPAYRKSEMVGNYIKVLRDDGNYFGIYGLYRIDLDKSDDSIIISFDGCGFSAWSDDLPEVFTQADLLNLYNGETDFEYILAKDVEKSKPQTKVEPKVKPTKSKASGITVPIKIEINDKPIIEENDEDIVIYIGRHTIMFDKNFGTYGIASCHPNELNKYDKFIGKCVAYWKNHNE